MDARAPHVFLHYQNGAIFRTVQSLHDSAMERSAVENPLGFYSMSEEDRRFSVLNCQAQVLYGAEPANRLPL